MRVLTMSALLVFVATATTASAQQPTLCGETLIGQPQVTSRCDVTGSSTISFSVSGVVAGAPYSSPYPGTFTESGVVTIGQQPSPGTAVLVTSFSASFVITSGSTVITGTKQLTTDIFIATGLGFCTEALRSFGVATTYEALIHTPSGSFTDRGKTGVALNEPGLSGAPSDFIEFFQSDLFAAEPVPTEAAKVTGGGSLRTLDANFGFVVQRKIAGGAISGEWQFVNHVTGEIVHSIAITDLAVAGNTATFSGFCRNESAPTGSFCMFTVTVQDNGEGANALADSYSVTGVGFNGGSGVVTGNIKIH